MASDGPFGFHLEEIPIPAIPVRPSNFFHIPVPADEPPQTREILLPPGVSPRPEKDEYSILPPAGYGTLDTDGLLNKFTKDTKAHTDNVPVCPVPPVSVKSSVLGTELAKKRLQAFCIQKKQTNASSPSSQQTSNLLNPVLIGNKVHGSLKKMSNVSKTNCLEEISEKMKSTPKKTYKKAMNGYERSCTTLTEILELKKEEDTKLALMKLGIPLGLVPGLTSKAMPTKAMPPIKNLLDPEEVELLLNEANLLPGNVQLKYKSLMMDNKKFQYKPPDKNDRDDNFRYKFYDRSRSSGGRYSERWDDNRNDRNDRHWPRRRRDSHSRSKRRSPESSSRRSNHHSSSSRTRKESPRDSKHNVSKREDSVEKPKPEINNFDLNESAASASVDNVDIIQPNEPIAQHELSNEVNDVDMFDIENSNKSNVSDDEHVIEKEISKMSPVPEVSQSSQLIYNKFLRDRFVPISEISDSITERIPSMERDHSQSRQTAVDLIEHYNTTSMSFNKNQDFDLSDSFNSSKVLYSPGMESSREPTPLFHNLSLTNKTSFAPSVDRTLNDEFNIESGKVDNIWLDIEKICQPNKHSSIKCLRKTCTQPSLDYCENLNACQCLEMRTKCFEKLSSNADVITASMSTNQSNDNDEDLIRNWYPKTDNAFKDISPPEVFSNWETDDSSSLSSNPVPKLQDNLVSLKPEDISQHKETVSNFTGLNISSNVVPPTDKTSYNTTMTENAPSIPLPPATSLDSEYEKFMEAVWPEIAVETNEPEKVPDSLNTAKEMSPVHSSSQNFEEFSLDGKPTDGNFLFDKDNSDFIMDTTKFSPEKIVFSNLSDIDKCNSKLNLEDSLLSSDIFADSLINNTNKNEKQTTADCWSSDNLSDDQKKDKHVNSNNISSKPTKQRKGHAKISSRRHKGKQKKKSNKKDNYLSSSSTDSSSNSEGSSSESSNSDDCSISDDSTTTSSDSSTSSLSSTSSSESTSSSSSDLSSLTSSDSSSDEMRSKSKKKLALSKKKYKKLSRSKRRKKQLLAKAKELAKKLKLRKKKRKLKEKLAREKKIIQDDPFLFRKDMTEFNLLNDDDNAQLVSDNMNIISKQKMDRKRTMKDKKNKVNHKKRKHSLEIDSSSSSYSSNESDHSSIEKTSKKRVRDICDNPSEFNLESKKSRIVEDGFVEDENYAFSMKTVLNIKKESVSDEEDIQKKVKTDESSGTIRTIYRQEIISASELQNDFLKVNTTKDNVIDIIVKTESLQNDNDEKRAIKKLPATENIQLESMDMHNNSSSPLRSSNKNPPESIQLTDKDTSDQNVISSVNLNEDINIGTVQNNHELQLQSGKNSTPRIGTVECDWRPGTTPLKAPREKKPSRWGSITDRDTSLLAVNSSIVVQNEMDSNNANPCIKIETDGQVYNSNNLTNDVDIKAENKIYKIQTISSRNIVQNTQNYENDLDNYGNYDVFDKQNDEFDHLKSEFSDARTPLRKISLDDRINMVLKYPGLEVKKEPLKPEKSPDKGILIVGGARLTRVDPRIVKTKKVSFADGFAPGQDSDCENELTNSVLPLSSPKGNTIKKKKRKSCGGHAYPCPSNWPDYHPRWDKLPPPAPPPGSPPPELCDKTNSILSSSNVISRIPRIANVITS